MEQSDEGGSTLTRARREILAQTVSEIRKAYREQREWDAYMLFESVTDFVERLWMNVQLWDAPKARAAIKRFQDAERKANDANQD